MNQHQTHRMCARIHAAIELPLAVLLKQRQQSASSISALDEVKLIKLKVHLESAVRLVREQVGVRSLSGLLLYQTQAKEFQVVNLNLAAAVSVTGHSSYVNNEKENAEDEKKDRVLLAQLVEAAKGRVSSYFFFSLLKHISSTFVFIHSFIHFLGVLPMMIYNLSTSDNIKKQLEGDFNVTMSSIATSPPNPAWFINGEFVVTKLDRRSAQIKLGDGGYGSVLLGQFLDVGVAKKVFHKADEFDEKEVEL